jgi:DNA-binding transcriptional ArsR family regulator
MIGAHARINHMVESRAQALDRLFHALASEPRREILRRSARRPCTVTELAKHFDMSLAAVAKHVAVLDEAKLLSPARQGRRVWRQLNPAAMAMATASIDELRALWEARLDGLEQFLEAPKARGRRKRRGRR